jgi:hypothetical protein
MTRALVTFERIFRHAAAPRRQSLYGRGKAAPDDVGMRAEALVRIFHLREGAGC